MIITSPAAPGLVRVMFRMRYGVGSHDISVVGDFNAWSRTANPMTCTGYGVYSAEMTVPSDRRYRFRYLVDNLHWQIEWAAKGHAPNEIGGYDSVLDLTEAKERTLPPRPRWISSSTSTMRTL